MNWHNIYRILKADYLILLPILALAFYIAFIPHHNYPYPVHVDEWVHLTHAKAILQAGDTTYLHPFYGPSIVSPSSNLAAGFHLFWGVFHQISGISWLTISKYFPGIIFVITVLSVYVLARREGFGWEAAFFTCLIPTTVGILGPGFLIPMALGLLFIPLSLFLVFNFRTAWSYLVLFVFTCFLLSMHAATAVGLVIILAPYIILNLRGNFKHSLGIMLALVIPFVAPFPWVFSMLLPTAKALFSPQTLATYVDLPRIINTYGYLPILFCILGTFTLAIRGEKRNYGLVLGLLALLVMLVTFFTFHYGVSVMYYRGLMYMMLMVSVVAGAGLMWVKNLRLPARLSAWLKVPFITENAGLMWVKKLRLPAKFSARLRAPFVTEKAGYILCLIFIGLTLAMCIPSRLDTPYYHMIDEQDYQAFVWIRENVDDKYDKAILDPWKATAFTAITGKRVYTRIHSYPTSYSEKAYAFLKGGCTDTAFLRESGISIIYTRWECRNPDLVELRRNIYLLEEAEATE